MSKMKNVLRGYMSRKEVDEIVVLEGNTATYWGDPEGLLKEAKNKFSVLKESAERILNSEVESVVDFNGYRFIFQLKES